TRAPDVAPGLRLRIRVGAEVHLRRIGLGQIVRVEARGDDRAAQIVALDAGEVARVDDVLAARLDDHPTVVVDDIGLIRRQNGGCGLAGATAASTRAVWPAA